MANSSGVRMPASRSSSSMRNWMAPLDAVKALTLEPAEMIVALWFPPPPTAAAAAFEEFTERAGDFALASVCTVVERVEGVVGRARIALGSVAGTPLRARCAGQPVATGRLGSVIQWLHEPT